jgi:hypothetical protein
MRKLVTVGSKKAVEPKKVNSEILTSAKKQGNFDLVSGGRCPHCDSKLGDEIKGKGVGFIRVCTKCQHRWYLNRKIRTTKCQTCSSDKRKSVADVANDSTIDETSRKCYNLPVTGESSSGRTADSGSVSEGSNPSSPARVTGAHSSSG